MGSSARKVAAAAAPGPYFDPPSSSHEAQFTRAEAAKLEAELALSTKHNGKSETLQSATVDLTSKGLLVVTWDDSNPALARSNPVPQPVQFVNKWLWKPPPPPPLPPHPPPPPATTRRKRKKDSSSTPNTST